MNCVFCVFPLMNHWFFLAEIQEILEFDGWSNVLVIPSGRDCGAWTEELHPCDFFHAAWIITGFRVAFWDSRSKLRHLIFDFKCVHCVWSCPLVCLWWCAVFVWLMQLCVLSFKNHFQLLSLHLLCLSSPLNLSVRLKTTSIDPPRSL